MRRFPLALLAASSVALLSCQDASAPVPLESLEFSIVSGDGQSAPPGTELPNPLVVFVKDHNGNKIKGQLVNFRVVAGGGSVFGGAAITTKDGIAQERWTLGPSGPQQLEARAVDGETGEARTFATFTATLIDAVPPTVTINQASVQPDPTAAGPILFTILFSEAVTGFSASDVSFAGSTVGGTLAASTSGSGASYTLSVTGMTGSGTVVASVPPGAAADGAANPSAASTSTDNTVTFLGAQPTVTINQSSGQSDPTNASPILFTVLFSEPVTGFTASDVSFAGSTVGGTLITNASGSGASYTVSVTGMVGSGIVMASVPAGAAVNAASTASLASTSTDNSVTFDNVAPTVTINQASTQPDPTSVSPIRFAVLFSEAVLGFDASDVSFAGTTTGGTIVAGISGSGASYTLSVTGAVGSGIVQVSVGAGAATDLAGNASTASTSTDNTVAFIDPAPTVTINQASSQPDPTNASPILFTVVFSETVTEFDASDVDLSASSLGGLAASVSGSGATYTVSVTGMNGVGSVIASVVANAAHDLGGQSSAASTSTDNMMTFDNVQPTVTINQASSQNDPTNASPILFSVLFSEAVTGFTGADIDLSASSLSGLVASVSGSGASYTVSVTGMNGVGTVIASVAAGAVTDAAGNANLASTSTDNMVTFDNVSPTVTINQASGQSDPTNASPIQFTVLFSEGVIGFTGADISFAGSTLGGLVASVTGSGASYTVSVTGMAGMGFVVASIPASAVTDLAGNTNTASTSTDNQVKHTP